MNANGEGRLVEVLDKHEASLMADWSGALLAGNSRRVAPLKEPEVREQCTEFLRLVREAARGGGPSTSRHRGGPGSGRWSRTCRGPGGTRGSAPPRRRASSSR